MKFTYSSGQRILDGYTLKRGVGHGGFGEVYFAVSDGGKEVALKVIRNNLDVELRGMSQCLNFKHPNLVQLYDIREDAHGDHWVIMEYVSGESLNNILARHPNGMPAELAQQWFLGLASAVTYLHDHGIVHRDLKPGNIFIENGTVKVGDYGLCKCVSQSQRSAQTQSVGTVHYMAPEISSGNYNKQIDVYAAGVILYEMLTGRVPFEGESVGEILMKHLTTPADLSLVPAGYVPVLHKALAKNPALRYRSMADLARDVQGTGATPIPVPVPQPIKPLYEAKPIPIPPQEIPRVQPVTVPSRTRLIELSQSLVLATLLAALFTVLWAAVLQTNNLTTMGRFFFLTTASCWAILIPAKLWSRRASESLARRAALMCLGLGIGMLAIWLEGYDFTNLFANQPPAQNIQIIEGNVAHAVETNRHQTVFDSFCRPGSTIPIVASYLSYFGLAFFGLRWWQMTDRRRTKRFSFYSVVAAAILGFLLMIFWHDQQYGLGVVTLIMTAVIVQLVSPWQQPLSPKPRKLRLPHA